MKSHNKTSFHEPKNFIYLIKLLYFFTGYFILKLFLYTFYLMKKKKFKMR